MGAKVAKGAVIQCN